MKKRILSISVILIFVLLFPAGLNAEAFKRSTEPLGLFTEDFNAEISVKGRHSQAQTGLPVKDKIRDAFPEEKEKLIQLLEQCTPLERDWLFQAGNNPTAPRVQQEIRWTRELADRLAKASATLDVTAELKQLEDFEGTLGSVGSAERSHLIRLYLAIRRVKRVVAFRNPAVGNIPTGKAILHPRKKIFRTNMCFFSRIEV